jgi:hypothetical protein
MPIQLNEENGGKILVIHVTGKLVKEDYPDLVSESETHPARRKTTCVVRYDRLPGLGCRRGVGGFKV